MSTNAVAIRPAALPQALMMDEDELISVLANSVYPGARLESIKMVVAWCRAQGKDPLKKPVHIMPTRAKVNGKWQDRDVIMPGIGDYRTDAARSGAYLGMSEPEFGPWVEEELGGEQVQEDGEHGSRTVTKPKMRVRYPEWCKVVVKRLVAGQVAEFPAVEFWRENYATKDRKTACPNEMWAKRPAGQLVKCAEAQALRKAFPELGSAPTAEEMEGKVIDMGEAAVVGAEAPAAPAGGGIKKPAAKSKATPAPAQEPAERAHLDVDPETGEVLGDSTPAAPVAPGDLPVRDQSGPATIPAKKPAEATGEPVTAGMVNVIRKALARSGKDEAALCSALGVEKLEALPRSRVNDAIKAAEAA